MEAPILPRKKALGPAPGQPADQGHADCQNRSDPRGPLRAKSAGQRLVERTSGYPSTPDFAGGAKTVARGRKRTFLV